MKIVNIHNQFKTIYKFIREDNGKLTIEKDDKFWPHFYNPDPEGEFMSYDGKKLKKIFCKSPNDVWKMKDDESYGADIKHPVNYIVNRIPKFDKCNFKYMFWDVEMECTELPDPYNPIFPISCVTIYNSYDKSMNTWYIGDYQGTQKQCEIDLFDAVVNYLRKEQPDLILGWNGTEFDYAYMFTRYQEILGENFAKVISPIEQYRPDPVYSDEKRDKERIWYPAGISVVDYLELFKKVYMREQSYTLDRVAQKHLKDKEWGKTDFSESSLHVKEKNVNDVKRMLDLENKYNFLDYFDEIRRITKCLWEDLPFNSKVIDCLVLAEAKRRNVIPPSKPRGSKEKKKGAYRMAIPGLYNNVYKADLSSCYPNMIINFGLDPVNIIDEDDSENLSKSKEILGTHFKQDQSAIYPTIAKGLIEQKNKLKKVVNSTELNSEANKMAQKEYDAVKGLVNSVFGVSGLPSFRLYDVRVFSAITYLARDLLHYLEDEIKKKGREVIYTDTDGIMYQAEEDSIEYLKELVNDWGMEKHGVKIDIDIEPEGIFTKLLILGSTRYYGYLKTDKGITTEIKGVEIKRASSSKYEAKFQKELIEKVLNGNSRDNIIEWIREQKKYIKTLPLAEIGFPSKKSNKKYMVKTMPIKAVENTNRFKPFTVNSGDLFYYIFVKNFGKADVLAFNESDNKLITKDKINWKEVERRSIMTKSNKIFKALGWDSLQLTDQTSLF